MTSDDSVRTTEALARFEAALASAMRLTGLTLSYDPDVRIEIDDPFRADVQALLDEHLADMRATSPPESKHALDHGALAAPDVTFWTVREDGVLLGCGALKELDPQWGEIKSMRTTPRARGRGVATSMLTHLLAEARHRGYRRLSLETGSHDYFAPARRLYAWHGFTECGPFANYVPDPNSVYLTLEIDTAASR